MVGGVIIHFLSLCLSTCVCRVLLLCSISLHSRFFLFLFKCCCCCSVFVQFFFRLPFFYSSRHVALYDQRQKQKSKRRRRANFYLFYFKGTTTRFFLFLRVTFLFFFSYFLILSPGRTRCWCSIVLRCCSPRASSERMDGRTDGQANSNSSFDLNVFHTHTHTPCTVLHARASPLFFKTRQRRDDTRPQSRSQ